MLEEKQVILQALKIIQERPVKYGTLMVTCKGVGYGGVPRDMWKELIDNSWLVYQYRSGKISNYLILSYEAGYYLREGRLPLTLQERNVCIFCKGRKGWQGISYFVPCPCCNGDGLYHG